MASSTPFSSPPAAAARRRPWIIRWWYDPTQRRRVITVTVLALLYGSGLAYGSWTRVCAAERCPSITRIDPRNGRNVQLQTSKVYAADGRLITELGIERRTVLPLEQIPVHVRQAFIAVEDKRFYRHSGIDYWRILGAIRADVMSLSWAQGFSTITMQLARNVFPEHLGKEKKIARKLREARVAVELERNFPKDTILELYLNQISLGPNVAGVEAASQVFFGKSARDLNVAEAATLAALPKAPGTYNPRTHPDRAVRRRNIILNLMRDQDFLSPEDAEFWKAYPLVLTTRRTNYGDVAPYFVEWLRSSFLEPRFGRDLYEKGLRIYTTLDLDMQEAAEQALESQLDEIESGVYSNGKFEGKPYREYIEQGRATPDDQGPFAPYLQGALLALDARTGNILAMVGGRDFVDSKWNRVTQSARPPGSTFKPFVYSAAVRAGHPVTEMLDDTALDPEHNWLMLDMMRDVMRCQPGTGPHRCGTAAGAVGGLHIPMAGKTGTTDDYTDAWFVGFTPEIVTGIWVGYDLQRRIMNNAGGGRIVAPVWTKFMRDVYERRPAPADWARPDDLVTREVDWSNGFLATPFCPLEVRRWEWFYPGTEPTQVCQVHSPFGVGVTP